MSAGLRSEVGAGGAAAAGPPLEVPFALRYLDIGVLESLFDRTSDTVFFIKNAHLQYTTVNTTLIERSPFGTKADLIGRTAAEVFGEPLGTSFQEQDRSVIEKGEEIRDRLELHLYRGRAAGWCMTYKMPVRDADGIVVGLIGISRDLQEPDPEDAICRRLAKAVEKIQRDFVEPLRVEELAAVAGLSRARFERHVRRIFGMTPGQLLAKTRLDAASSMLRDQPEAGVADIAHACGFSDHSAFSRSFKSVVGLTPTEFRQTLPR